MNLLYLYKKDLSPALHSFLSPLTGSMFACRFTPTCSDYTRQAVTTYGIIHGSLLGIKRFLRCNPLFKGGFDPLR